MCVMCACINRDAEAAPILMNMGKRIEGLWSGYYTGLGCIGDDGVIRAVFFIAGQVVAATGVLLIRLSLMMEAVCLFHRDVPVFFLMKMKKLRL